MMRAVLVVTMWFLSTGLGYAQKAFTFTDIPTKDDYILYERIVKIDSCNQSRLYQNAKLFLANNFKDAKAVIQIDDKENGKIVGKGILGCHFKYAFVGYQMRWHFILDITLKEGKFRAQISDFSEFEIFDTYWHDFPMATTSYLKWAMKGKNPGYNFYKSFHEANLAFLDLIEKEMRGRAKIDDF